MSNRELPPDLQTDFKILSDQLLEVPMTFQTAALAFRGLESNFADKAARRAAQEAQAAESQTVVVLPEPQPDTAIVLPQDIETT